LYDLKNECDVIMIETCHFSRLIQTQAQKYDARIALSYRDYEVNQWRDISWNTFSNKVGLVSDALVALGVQTQENIAVFSQNKPEVLYVDFGAYGIRAVTIPFYPTSSRDQVNFMLEDASIRVLFVGEQQQYDIAFPMLAVSNTLQHIVIFDSKVKLHPSDRISMYFDDFLALGMKHDHEEEVQCRLASSSPRDLANILYTSGTTGNSKGVMMTHEMYLEAMKANDSVLTLSEKDVILNFLPFTHVFERGWAYLCLCAGCRLAINLRPSDILQSLREVRPTCMSSVPRFWEKIYQGVMERIRVAHPMKRGMIEKALKVGKAYHVDTLGRGKKPSAWLRLRYAAADLAVLLELRRQLGLERGNFFPTAGATISKEVETFVHSCGINMVTGYGLTETTATVSCDHKFKPYSVGSVGRVLQGIDIKIADNNEVLLCGKTITKGYYHRPVETAEAIDADGWFHTGDAGYFNNEGELFLTDRIKDLYKTSNGKYIAPQQIEAKLMVDKYIDQIVVVADQMKYVTALIVPSYDLLQEYFRGQRLEFSSREELCLSEAVKTFMMDRIDTLQQSFAGYECVKRITLLPNHFSIDRNEITNTLKAKRKVIFEHYRTEIENMYT